MIKLSRKGSFIETREGVNVTKYCPGCRTRIWDQWNEEQEGVVWHPMCKYAHDQQQGRKKNLHKARVIDTNGNRSIRQSQKTRARRA